MTKTRFRQTFLLLLLAAITIAFVAMIRAFLLTILLAAIFAALSYPMYRWFLRTFRNHSAVAAIATLLVLVIVVVGPLLAVLGAGANEALRVTETVRPRSSGSWTGRANSTGGCVRFRVTATSNRIARRFSARPAR